MKDRSHFGLNDADHVYICPQTLFKFHPQFDTLLARILRGDPAATLVLLEATNAHWGELLRARFNITMPDVAARIRFLPQQHGADFINLLAISDVMLDTIHFCGFNTSFEGFAAGIPVVTLADDFMRGRHTLSLYRKMGFMDCVARDPDEYVDIALRLGTAPAYRAQISRRIAEARDVLWEEKQVVEEFERFFEGTVAQCNT